MTGQNDRHVVAVVGDGALTGGMTWEALNNISDDNNRRLVIVVNDNGRSYAPTIGGMARFLNDGAHPPHLPRPAAQSRSGSSTSSARPGRAFYRGTRGALHGFLARFANNEALYSNLDIKYIGPVDGHDMAALEEALQQAKNYERPGARARDHAEGPRLRAGAATTRPTSSTPSAQIDPETGEPVELQRASRPGPTCSRDETRADSPSRTRAIVGITAAMLRPTGLAPLAERFPDRVLRRRHRRAARRDLAPRASPSAACIRSSRSTRRSSNRAFDQVLMDVALHKRRRHLRARPRRRHRPGRAEPPRHVGSRDAAGRPGHPHRLAARRRDARGGAGARRSPSRTRRPCCGSRRAACGPTIPALERARRTASTCSREATATDVLLVAVGPMADLGPRGRRPARRPGHRRHRRRPALGRCPIAPSLVDLVRRSTASSSRSRTASASAGSARASARTCGRRASTRR